MDTKKRHRLIALIAVIAALAIVAAGVLIVLPLTNGIADHVLYDTDRVTITSPSGQTAFVLTAVDGRLTYRVERDGKLFLHDSPMGVTIGQDTYGLVSSIEDIGEIDGKLTTETREINGRTARADDPCVYATVAVDAASAFTLETMVFDNGIAFCYRLPDGGHRTLKSEETGFVLPTDSALYAGEAHQYYETIHKFYDPAKRSHTILGTPATVRLAKDEGYTAILEGNLQNYPGMKLAWDAAYSYRADLGGETFAMSGEIVTPWRIVSIGDDLNELVNNTILYQVCDQPDKDLYGDNWVKPGRATWSWITGRTVDSVTPQAIETYTDYAAKLGFEYNIIDEGWIDWSGYQSKLPALAEQGAAYGVGQILWTGVNAGASFGGGIDTVEDAYAFIDLLAEQGMAGGKIDFFPTEDRVDMGVNIYVDILRYAAEKQLVINFHGCNKPTGYDATYPNELNREAILGLESTDIQNRRTQAKMFVTQPFVRNLAGHADYTPAVDSAFHMAQLVLTDAPMQAIGSDPKDILASPALEMIKSVPTVWEETIVIDESRIGQCAIIARKSRFGNWFVGGINSSSSEETLTLELADFLGEGTYRCELWTDDGKMPVQEVSTVTAEDTLTIPFEKVSGFILRFDRVTLSQYGGEITGAITVDTASDDTALAYAVDTGDGFGSYKAIASGESFTLSESAYVSFKITKGPDKGHEVTYRYNTMTP